MARSKYDILEEGVLIQHVREGDNEAWEYITRKFYASLLNFIYGMVHERETAEELVQDVFVNFWVKRERLEITISLKSYLYRAARNHTLNFIKRRKFEQDYQQRLGRSMSFSKNETEDAFLFSELEKKLYAAIESLPEQRREIFRMSRFEEMTYKEIAEAMDIPVRTVHYQIGLALRDLRDMLKGHADPHLMGVGIWISLGMAVTAVLRYFFEII